MLDVVLIKKQQHNILLVRGHYLVCDLVSWQILFDEFSVLLKDKGITANKQSPQTFGGSVAASGSDSRTRLTIPFVLLEDHFSGKTGHKDMEAFLACMLDDLLSNLLQNNNYSILLGQNDRKVRGAKNEIIGRYSHMVVLPGFNHANDIFQNLPDIREKISSAETYKAPAVSPALMANLDYLGDLTIHQREGVIKLDRGYLSSVPGQLFPLELVAWIEQDELVIETAVDKNRLPVGVKSFQENMVSKLTEYLRPKMMTVN